MSQGIKGYLKTLDGNPGQLSQIMSTNSIQLHRALNHCSHAHSTSIAIALVQAPCTTKFVEQLVFHFSSRTDSKQLLPLHVAGKPHSQLENCKYRYHVVPTDWTRYCNWYDITSVHSLNLRKLPGHFSYSMGTRLQLQTQSAHIARRQGVSEWVVLIGYFWLCMHIQRSNRTRKWCSEKAVDHSSASFHYQNIA